MSWRSGNRRQRDREKPFSRDWKNESFKEGGSSIVQQAGLALGALSAFVATRLGLPAPIAAVVGSITATAIAVVGKGYVAALVNAVDRHRQAKRRSGNGWGALSSTTASEGSAPLMAGSGRSASSTDGPSSHVGVGEVVSAIGEVMSQLEQAERQLAQTTQSMRASQESLTQLLFGARSEQVNRQALIAAWTRVGDCVELVKQANQNLQAYLRAI